MKFTLEIDLDGDDNAQKEVLLAAIDGMAKALSQTAPMHADMRSPLLGDESKERANMLEMFSPVEIGRSVGRVYIERQAYDTTPCDRSGGRVLIGVSHGDDTTAEMTPAGTFDSLDDFIEEFKGNERDN